MGELQPLFGRPLAQRVLFAREIGALANEPVELKGAMYSPAAIDIAPAAEPATAAVADLGPRACRRRDAHDEARG